MFEHSNTFALVCFGYRICCIHSCSLSSRWTCLGLPSQSVSALMLPQQVDVNVPPALQSQLGTLLKKFADFAIGREFMCDHKKTEDDGNHVTEWWCMVVLDGQAPRKSLVQFGETVHAKVNPVPHLWVRAKARYRQCAVSLLQDFIIELQAPPPSPVRWQRFIADDGKGWWYLSNSEWFWEDDAAWTKYTDPAYVYWWCHCHNTDPTKWFFELIGTQG